MIGTDNNKPTYKWLVSGGRITGAQGTSTIEVQVDRAANDVTATVEITSFPRECNNKASCSVHVASKYPAHWFAPVIDPKKPDWEILPQEAGPGEVILRSEERRVGKECRSRWTREN